MERMEERINEPKDRIIEITQSEQQRKRMGEKINSLREKQDYNKRSCN